MPRFDCQACGACCCNTRRNRAAGNSDYIEIEKTDVLLQIEHRPLLKTIAARNEDGAWFMKLTGVEQRCINLDGDLGEGVGCSIYKLRPTGCKRVEAGDEECLAARRLHLFNGPV